MEKKNAASIMALKNNESKIGLLRSRKWQRKFAKLLERETEKVCQMVKLRRSIGTSAF
jgi:hypothetical protein